jgi:transposase
MRETTLRSQDTGNEGLLLAFDLSSKTWKLAFAGRGRTRDVTVPGGDLGAMLQEVTKAKERFGLDPAAPVLSCYEAGRDGFWLHRALEEMGVANLVVDPSSIEVDRRFRRAKTDRLDAQRLLRQLQRYAGGDRHALRVVRVPSVEDEDARRPHRELQRLRQERTAHSNRIRGLLTLYGVRLGGQVVLGPHFTEQLEAARQVNGEPLPLHLREELLREYARWGLVDEQLRAVEVVRRQRLAQTATHPHSRTITQLTELCGIGLTSAALFTHEFFGWRDFQNRRELTAAAGLAPTPFASGDREIEQGISKAGNRRVRATLIQIAWGWLRYQPDSKLSRWFQLRFASSPRLRRIGIVALARRLLIDLWRYARSGVLPEGAQLKATA